MAAPPDTAPWRELMAETVARLRPAAGPAAPAEARWIVERASGLDGAELVTAGGQPARARAVAHLDAMVARRAAGEPLQYVIGRWGFRRLDLYLDRRALIPRPETEVVVEVALAELAELAEPYHRTNEGGGGGRAAARVAVDLGTGSGAIALSLALEGPEVDVWATDVSPDTLAVARANLAALGQAARRVRLVAGSWYGALPDELRGRVDLLVANPPYVAEGEQLPPEVADWEPREALVAGPTGLEAIEAVLAGAPDWLAPAGALVLELAPHQAERAADLAGRAGLVHVDVRPDLAGRPRVLVAHRPGG